MTLLNVKCYTQLKKTYVTMDNNTSHTGQFYEIDIIRKLNE